MGTRRKPLAGYVRVIGGDSVRARRAAAQGAQGRVAGPGQVMTKSGQISPNLGDALFLDRAGRTQIRVDGTSMEIATGSPKRLQARAAPSDVEAVQENVDTNTEMIEEVDDRVTAILVDHDTRLAIIETERTPQPFVADGALDQTVGLEFFAKIDNTAGDVTVEIVAQANAVVNVIVTAYDGLNVCRLQPTTGNINLAADYPFTAALDGGRFLCDGTDWWRIP